MKRERIHSAIFVIVVGVMILGSAPYMIKNHIFKKESVTSVEGEELGGDDDEVELDDAFLSYNSDEQDTDSFSNEEQDNETDNTKEDLTSNQTSNVTSNVSSNLGSNQTSNKVTNVTSNKTQTTSGGKKNSVSNPGMTYTGFTKVDSSYFDDALFIGDSRTVGLRDYGNIKNASFFCDVGMSSYNISGKNLNVKGVGQVTFDQLLSKKQFGKIYIMLGVNEAGYGLNQTANKYAEIVKKIKNAQPSAIIYIQANLHVSKQRNDTDKYVNNDRLNSLNELMSRLANNTNTFYIDINEYFDDANGNLKSAYTSDGTHPYAKYYAEWTNWIMEHAVAS